MGSRQGRFQHAGIALVRASSDPGDLDLPESIDLVDAASARAGLRWLRGLWGREEMRVALGVASPAFAAQVAALVDSANDSAGVDGDHLRRTVVAMSSYVRRWQRRATPFGLFAGVALASAGPTQVSLDGHRVRARADGRWFDQLVRRREQHHSLLPRLTVVANDTGHARGGRFVVPADADHNTINSLGDNAARDSRADEDGRRRGASLETTVRRSDALRAALAETSEPVVVAELTERLALLFPNARAESIQRMLAELIDIGALLTNLRAPMTTTDPAAHLLAELAKIGCDDLPNVSTLADALRDVDIDLSGVIAPTGPAQLESAARTLRTVQHSPGRVLAVDLTFTGRINVADDVLTEAESAATCLLRLTPFPFGEPVWKDYHARFLDRFGHGAAVPVRDLVVDSGLGLPAGYLGAPRPRAAPMITERDTTLLRLIQEAVNERRDEVTLTEQVIEQLRVGDHQKMITPPRVEVAFQLHAASAAALDSGRFQLWVTGAPMHATSMIGRFAHALPESDRQRLQATYQPTEPHVIAAQLSFRPRRAHNENIARTPQMLPYVIALGEHRAPGDALVIGLDDLAVTADDTQLALIRLSTGQRVQAHIPHALEATAQTPPLARFLSEVGAARSGAFGPLGLGVAHDLPFLPRVRHGRSVLSPARWRVPAAALPRHASKAAWRDAFSVWRGRWRVPTTVVLCENDKRLPLDLDDDRDLTLLRARAHRATAKTSGASKANEAAIELREAGPDSTTWAGRACELVVPLTARTTAPEPEQRRAAVHVVGRADLLPAGGAAVLRSTLSAHPQRFDELITCHLPRLLGPSLPVRRWWFWRQHNPSRPDNDQHLALCLRLGAPEQYGTVAERFASWAAELRADGLVAEHTLGTYTPPHGVFGRTATEAAEDVLAADSACAAEQIRFARHGDSHGQALAAVSLVDLVTSSAASPHEGLQMLLACVPHELGKVDRRLRDVALTLVADDHAHLRRSPAGQAVMQAWERRRDTLITYYSTCGTGRPGSGELGGTGDGRVLRALLHEHHLRAVSVDPGVEKVTRRLARAVAQYQLATHRRGEP